MSVTMPLIYITFGFSFVALILSMFLDSHFLATVAGLGLVLSIILYFTGDW
jgi:hypothetical protein